MGEDNGFENLDNEEYRSMGVDASQDLFGILFGTSASVTLIP
jgi:hypothetical protein